MAESSFPSFKTEWMLEDGYTTITAGTADAFRYSEELYNRKRLHSYLGYVSPAAIEAARCLD